jgi:hypothetical protein
MTTTVEAIYKHGKLYLSGPLSLPDKSRVLVTIESDVARAAWSKLSEENLSKTWDNASDSVFNDLPGKPPMEGLVANTWEKLGPAPDVDYDQL